ncbi:transposase DDE domain protein, partial [Leptospira kirschneri str. 2008720114]
LTVIASFLSNSCLEKCSGISFIDSTILKVCDNRRIHSHKVFKDIAQRGKSSTGCFTALNCI